MTDETMQSSMEAAPSLRSPGASLSAARNEIGLSVADVARSLRLSVRQIEAIEADDFDKLPGKTFLRGFLRNYAKLLNIDPEPLLESCQHTAVQALTQLQPQPISVPPGQVEISASRSQRTFSGKQSSPWLRYVPVALIILALLGWVVFELLDGSRVNTVVVKPSGDDSAAVALPLPPVQSQAQSELPAQAAVETPLSPAPKEEISSTSQKAPNQDAAIPQGTTKVKLTFSGESWIDIKDKSGRTIFKQTGQAGNEQVISGTPPFALTVGKAANVKVYYNDQPIDLVPHTNGDVARLTLN